MSNYYTQIDNALVKRQLVISNGIEQVLLIEDLEEASKIMFDSGRPRNVKRCFSIDRHNPRRGYALTYNRSGGPGQSPIPAYQGQPRMKTDHESQIRYASYSGTFFWKSAAILNVIPVIEYNRTSSMR